MSKEDGARVRIFKFNPDTDKKPYYVTFQGIPYKQRRVLDVLKYINENFDPDLAFRCSCRAGLCDSCALKVNKKTVLSCVKLAEEDMVIEPPEPFMIVKDLVVDFQKRKVKE